MSEVWSCEEFIIKKMFACDDGPKLAWLSTRELHMHHPISAQSHLTIQRLVAVLSVSLKCPLIHNGVVYPGRNCYPLRGSLQLHECQEAEKLWQRL